MIIPVGKHRVRHGDLMDGYEELTYAQVDYVYTDPPWGDGNLKYWQTMNKKMNGAEPKPIDFAGFLAKLFDVIQSSCKPEAMVWVEYGKGWAARIEEQAARVGLQILAVSYPRYGSSNLPLAHYTLAWKPRELPIDYQASIAQTKGFPTLLAAVAPFAPQPGQAILDPCCGLGYSARLAVHYGMTFYGNELNHKRLMSTVSILQKDKDP